MKTHLPSEISRMFNAVYYGGNYTWVNIKDSLDGIDWIQATTKYDSLNSIAGLVFHMNYYVRIVAKVLEGELLRGSDKESFDHPPIHSEDDWEMLLKQFWSDAERFSRLLEKMPEELLWQVFKEEKYGNYYKNIHGVIEHNHYHLGQIVLLKKLMASQTKN